MTRILVVATNAEMRQRIAASLASIDCPMIVVADRRDVIDLLDNIRQVMVYTAHYGDNIGWVAETMEAHPELRVVYLTAQPWASLNYERARCMIAPHRPEALRLDMLQRMVLELLASD